MLNVIIKASLYVPSSSWVRPRGRGWVLMLWEGCSRSVVLRCPTEYDTPLSRACQCRCDVTHDGNSQPL